MARIELRTVGVVKCGVTDRKQMPPFGVPATIGLFPEFAGGLRHLEKHSHLWVLAWLHEADRDRLLVTPRGVTDESDAGLHGVFAVRSPTRPNPIAMTAARILRVDGNRIALERLDLVDGTAILDLKPYFRSRDAIYISRNEQIGKPASRAALLGSLVYQAENFHGERCGGLALGARIVEHWRSIFFDFGEVTGSSVRTPESARCLVDTLMALLGATPGRATLEFHRGNSVTLQKDERQYLYILRDLGDHRPGWEEMTFEDVMGKPDSELFVVQEFE